MLTRKHALCSILLGACLLFVTSCGRYSRYIKNGDFPVLVELEEKCEEDISKYNSDNFLQSYCGKYLWETINYRPSEEEERYVTRKSIDLSRCVMNKDTSSETARTTAQDFLAFLKHREFSDGAIVDKATLGRMISEMYGCKN